MNKKIKKIISYLLILLIVIFSFRLYINSDREIVNYENFTDYFQAGEADNGGLEIADSNFTTFTKDYTFIKKEEEKVEEEKKKPVKKEVTTVQYKVQKRDNVASIAKKFGVSQDTIKMNNTDVMNGRLKVGSTLTFPSQNGLYYKIQKGETLSKIAKKYGISVVDIVDNNNINPKRLKPGTTLYLKNVSLKKFQDVEERLIAASKPKEKVKEKGKEKVKGSKKDSHQTTDTSIPTTHESKASKETAVEEENDYTPHESESFAFPVRYAGVSSPFGNRYHPVLRRYILHTGVDLNAKYVPLRAAKDGVVTFAGYMSGYGKIIIIKHANGYETRYAHLSVISTNVGEHVNQGDLIGKTGNSGRVTGPHLHFEIRYNGVPKNPMKYLR